MKFNLQQVSGPLKRQSKPAASRHGHRKLPRPFGCAAPHILYFVAQNSIDTQDHSSYTLSLKKQCFINPEATVSFSVAEEEDIFTLFTSFQSVQGFIEKRVSMTAKLSGRLKMTAPLELGISTLDIEGMIHFYTEIVGLRLVADNHVQPEVSRVTGATAHGYRIVRLQTPYGERIKLVQSGIPPKQIEAGPYIFDRHGLAYLTFVIADLDEMILRLSDHGVKLFSGGGKVEVRPGVFAIFTIDPEGNVVEFVEYPDVASYRPDLYRWRQFC